MQTLHVRLYMLRKLNIFTSLKLGIVTVSILFKLFYGSAERNRNYHKIYFSVSPLKVALFIVRC